MEIAKLFLILCILVPISCGDDEDKSDEPTPPTNSNASLDDNNSIKVVALQSLLPSCEEYYNGWTYYIIEQQRFQYCDGGAWNDIELQGAQGEQGQKGDQGAKGRSADSLVSHISSESPTSGTIAVGAQYCANLVENGFDDWHIPTIREIAPFLGIDPSTEYLFTRTPIWKAPEEWMTVRMSDGHMTGDSGQNARKIRCVRYDQ